MTKIIHITDSSADGQRIELTPEVQTHLLWDALSNVGSAYSGITAAMHAYFDTSYSVEFFKAKDIHDIGKLISEKGNELTDAGRRLAMFAEGVKGDAFDGYVFGFDRTYLGPKVDGNIKTIYVGNKLKDNQTTYVEDVNSGVTVYMGINDDYPIKGDTAQGGVPYVGVSMDRARKEYIGENGEPILQIDLHDAALYDFNGDPENDDQPALSEMADRVPVYENIQHHPDLDDDSYRWTIDVILPWLKDEDDLPRIEHAHGPTTAAALKMAQEMGESYRKSGYLRPNEYPKDN